MAEANVSVWHVPGSAHVHRYRDCAISGPWHKYEPVEVDVPEIAPDLVPRPWRVCLLYEGDPLLICVPCEERYRSDLPRLAEAERAANPLHVVDVHGDLGVLGDDGVVRPWSVKRS